MVIFREPGVCLVSFFFSSRRRHTRCYRYWSSDVCCSDLGSYIEDGIARRWTRATASILLPIKPETDYTLIVRANVPPAGAGKKRTILVNDQAVGEMGSDRKSVV